MTFRLPFQISRVGAICRPVSADGLVSRLASRKGNLKKCVLYRTKQDLSSNLLQCKHKVSLVPHITKYSSTKLGEQSSKRNVNRTDKKSKSKIVVKDGEAVDYYQTIDDINFGPYLSRRPIQVKSRIKLSKSKNHNTHLAKCDACGMETYYHEIKNIDDTMNPVAVKPVISPPEPDLSNIMPDTDLKIQNDIWKKSGTEIINNLNSKNSIWTYIYGKRKALKHNFWKDFSTTKILNKIVQTQTSTKVSSKGTTVHQGTKNYSAIYLPKRKKSTKLNLDKVDNKELHVSSQLQQRLLHKSRQCTAIKDQKACVEEKSHLENCVDSMQNPLCLEPNAVSEVLGTKKTINDCKYKIFHPPLKLAASKIFVRNQYKASKTILQPETFIKVNPESLSKPNVIMATVNNRQLNNPSPEFMEQYSYNNTFYHMNAMKDIENYSNVDFKHPQICYNAENDTYLLHNELVAEAVIENETKPEAGKTWTTNSDEIDKASPPAVTAKKAKSEKKIKTTPAKKLVVANKINSKTSCKTTTQLNDDIITHCSSKIINVRNIQSAKAANLEKLNEAVSESKPKLVKLETPLVKKEEQKNRNKIKSSRLPKTLGEMYGVGKIPFLVEVSKPGQATHKQYLIVIQLPENNRQESPENNTNSPIPLTLNTDYNSDLLQEILLSPHDTQINCSKSTETNTSEQTGKKHVPRVGSMIGLVKVKNKILPLLEINDYRGFEPQLPTKLSQLNQPKANKTEAKGKWEQNTLPEFTPIEKKPPQKSEEQARVAAPCSGQNSMKTMSPAERYEQIHDKLQRVMHIADCIKEHRKSKSPVICKEVRQYSTMSKRNQIPKSSSYKILPKVRHTNRNADYQQRRNYSCRVCARCGQCPCVCYDCCGSCCPCSPCGWYPCNSCRPQCCPKFKLDYCCPRGRYECSIPVPSRRKIDAPYPSYGESMPMWCKEPTECFDYDQHILQPKNQVSQKIPLMQESIPKVTVVDPALERKCYRDKCCEPYYPPVDQRLCFDCSCKVPVDYCCPRARPHCFCWPERSCTKKQPPYRCFSDEELEFPEVEITEHDLARKFASDLYRRMGKKCKLPFAPACSVQCDLSSGEPKPVYKYDPKGHCATTCAPPGTYPACCTPVRIPPCQIPGYDTYNNCCMPTEGIKKTRCTKKCPEECCNCCPNNCCDPCSKE